jgi:hypothetical protein
MDEHYQALCLRMFVGAEGENPKVEEFLSFFFFLLLVFEERVSSIQFQV